MERTDRDPVDAIGKSSISFGSLGDVDFDVLVEMAQHARRIVASD